MHMSTAEMQPRVTVDYRPYEGRVIRIEQPMDEATRKAGVTAPAIELRGKGIGGSGLTEGLLAALLASFIFHYRKGLQPPEGWEERKTEWRKAATLEEIRSLEN